jgi:dephospho-CoA kinase
MVYQNCVVVAVTGGMGCGQTTVCKFLEKMGARVINADKVAKLEIEHNDVIKKELKKDFGFRILYRNGQLNRKYLAKLAFSDPAKTTRLNRIVHPYMVGRIVTMIEEARDSRKHAVIAVDAALIYELSLEHMFDAVVVVSSRMPDRIERIRARDKLSENEIIDRINRQLPIEEKAKWADFVIRNNKDLELLEKNSRRLYHQLEKLAQKKSRQRQHYWPRPEKTVVTS